MLRTIRRACVGLFCVAVAMTMAAGTAPAGASVMSGGPSNGIPQASDVVNGITQQAGASAQAVQVLPVNVNAPVAVLSSGSNNGNVTQSNASSANANAQNG